MRVFGIPESEIASLVRPVVGDDLDRDGILDRFARSAWSGIAEPGDGVAGRLVDALGAGVALDLVIRDDRDGIRAGLREAGASDSDLGDALARWRPRLDSGVAVHGLRQASRFAARLLVPDDPGWPEGLTDLGEHAPLALWQRGQARVPSLAVAIVGSRAATGYGESVTAEAASGLADRGIAVISGAAYGIDGAAHSAALASGGLTVAFLAGGVDRFYPAGHSGLLTRIVENGAVLSEMPCGVAPTRWRFLQRNRLIAAASAATIVVEAGRRSGSLNTAGHAAHLGRPLGAVPGPVTSSTSAGCHRMMREFGAVCVTSVDEMAELVTGIEPSDPRGAPGAHAPGRIRVLDALNSRPRPVEQVAALSGLSIDAVRTELGLLDLEGAVREDAAGWVRARGSG